jgi:hypothetical protein
MSSSVSFHGLGRILLTFLKRGNKDDRLTIDPDEYSTGYHVHFLQHTIRNTTETYLSNSELMPYLHRMFRTIELDVHAYDCVQIDCPSFPTVMIERTGLLNYFHILSDQIKSLQKTWPMEWSGKEYVRAKPSSESFSGEARLYVKMIKDDCLDDTLCIVPEDGGSSYLIRHEQNYLKNTTERVIPANDLHPYLQRFFTALSVDAEPYSHIQVDVPMYPCVMLKHSSIYSYLPLLLEQIQTTDTWPTEKSGKRRTSGPRRENDWDALVY